MIFSPGEYLALHFKSGETRETHGEVWPTLPKTRAGKPTRSIESWCFSTSSKA